MKRESPPQNSLKISDVNVIAALLAVGYRPLGTRLAERDSKIIEVLFDVVASDAAARHHLGELNTTTLKFSQALRLARAIVLDGRPICEVAPHEGVK
jgi:hypothetical protein